MKDQLMVNFLSSIRWRFLSLIILIYTLFIRESSPDCNSAVANSDACSGNTYCYENTAQNYYDCSNSAGSDKWTIGTAIYYYNCRPHTCYYYCYSSYWGDWGDYCSYTCYDTCNHGTKTLRRDCHNRCATCNADGW